MLSMKKKLIIILSGLIILLIVFGIPIRNLSSKLKHTVLKEQSLQSELTEAKQTLLDKENELKTLLNPEGGVVYNGWLTVDGTQLKNQQGEAFWLRGVSTHGITWFPEYGNYPAIRTTKEHGANLVRIAMYTTQYMGYDTNPQESKKTLRSILENVLAADMYAIVDWHVLSEQDPNMYVDEAIEFFHEISSIYKDEPGIIYEICNEPNGETTWEDIQIYAQQVIPVIRNNAPNAVIIVGTPEYSSRVDLVVDNQLNFDNVMYSYHYSAEYVGDRFDEVIKYSIENNIPIFVTQWGMRDGGSSEQMGSWLNSCRKFIDAMAEYKVSWAAWSLSNADNGNSLIRPECKKLMGWREEDLSEFGKLVFEKLKGE